MHTSLKLFLSNLESIQGWQWESKGLTKKSDLDFVFESSDQQFQRLFFSVEKGSSIFDIRLLVLTSVFVFS